MQIRNRALVLAGVASGFYTLTGCGSVASLAQSDAQAKKTSNASANLTEEAAASETAAADEQAQTTDAGTDGDEGEGDMPEFMKVVEAARAYTRTLLGLDDAPLKDFMATVQAAKALASSPEDFKAKIDPAKKALKEALDAQKVTAEQARKDHAVELQAIFDGTVKVFKTCAASIDLKPHRGPRGGEDGPVVMIGNGEFDGKFGDMKKKAGHGPEGRGPEGRGPDGRGPDGHGKGGKGRPDDQGPRGPRPDDRGDDDRFGLADETAADDTSVESSVDSAASTECGVATAALQALLPSN